MAKGKDKAAAGDSSQQMSTAGTATAGEPKWAFHLPAIVALGVLTWLCLSSCLDNTITTWDDTPYLRDDIYIKDLSWYGIKNIFTQPVMGNYHPLTILSFAIEYKLVHFEPWLYHFDSLMLHVLNAALVYWLVFLLCKKPLAAIVTALLFAIHPMHTESVAWVSGRKDVLCGFFYLAGCVGYVNYLRAMQGRKWIWYVIVMLLFVAALLSKGIAVTLPVVFLLIDYYEQGRIGRSALFNKLPYLLIAGVAGIITLKVQHAAGAMAMQKTDYSAVERLALGCYALCTYLWKAVLPVDLHCLYPYPTKSAGSIPGYYYVYPVAVAAIAMAAIRFIKSKVVVFGLLFFMATIVLLLQFIQVGESVVAERYSYLPYIGLFFVVGHYFAVMLEKTRVVVNRYMIIGLLGVYGCFLGYSSYGRGAVWYDELSLWTDEVAKEPVKAPQAWNNLGCLYMVKFQTSPNSAEKREYYDSAMYYLNEAILLKPDYVNPYVAMGDLQRGAGNIADAKKTFRKAFALHPRDNNLALELAICYYVTKDMDSAGIYFRKELELDTTNVAIGNYANYLEAINKNDSALLQFNKAIAATTNNCILYANRGKLLKKINRWDEARADFEAAIKINPDMGELYYLLSFCDTQRHDRASALQHVDKARTMGYKGVDAGYYEGLRR